jgi:hypothetical protein
MRTVKQSSVYTQNVGNGDRMIRYIIGAAFIGLFMAYQDDGNRYDQLLATLALTSVVIVSTAITRWDPVYAMLGINTEANARRKLRITAVNVGMADSALRLAVGSTMISGFMLFSPTPVGWTGLLPLLAIPIIATAIIGWCPIYALVKVNTLPKLRGPKGMQPKFTGPSFPRAGHTKAA